MLDGAARFNLNSHTNEAATDFRMSTEEHKRPYRYRGRRDADLDQYHVQDRSIADHRQSHHYLNPKPEFHSQRNSGF
jgi:hypothetical protein